MPAFQGANDEKYQVRSSVVVWEIECGCWVGDPGIEGDLVLLVRGTDGKAWTSLQLPFAVEVLRKLNPNICGQRMGQRVSLIGKDGVPIAIMSAGSNWNPPTDGLLL